MKEIHDEKYDAKRMARLKRRKRRQRQRAMLISVMVLLLAVIIGCAGYLIVKSGNKKAADKQNVAAATESMTDAVTEVTVDDAETEAATEAVTEVAAAETEAQTAAATEYSEEDLVAWDPTQITHIFFHSLVVDPAKGFSLNGEEGWDSMTPGFCQWMTTVSEFEQILQQMYDKGYVIVNIHELVEETTDSDGTVHMTAKQVMVPKGKTPFVMSFDDLSYYHSYDNRGTASKVILDENGKPTCEYIQDDGTTVTGDYDYIPILDKFIEAHPDFSWKGAKGIIALTGYDGILGYRTDIEYKTQESLQEDQVKWLEAHPDFNFDEECAEAKKVAQAIKDDGYLFASHTWGHIHIGDADMDKLQSDTQKWQDNVAPLIGGSDIIIFAHGQDLASWDEDYASTEKFKYLKSQGFNIYCNVDSSQYFVQIGDEYLRMGRRNVDGYRLWQAVYGGNDSLSDLIDPKTVFDPDRPTDESLYDLG